MVTRRAHRVLTAGRLLIEPLEQRWLLAAGDPDLAFSSDGRATLNFPGFVIADTALQADGKIVLAGRRGSFAAVARLNNDGTVDTGFGNGGIFEYGSVAVDLVSANGVAIAADGKIVVGGLSLPGVGRGGRFTVGRLMPNGTRDLSFGPNGGIVRSEVDGEIIIENSVAFDVAIQTDGKIIAVGQSQQKHNVGGQFVIELDMVVVRYNINGSHDASFADGDGTAVIEIEGTDDVAHAVTIDYTGNPLTNPRYGTIVTAGQSAAEGSPPGIVTLARLNPNGTADNTFSGDGRLRSPQLSLLGIEFARGVVVQPGGKIVIGGTAQDLNDPNIADFLMARYQVNGALDTSFGPNNTGVVQEGVSGNDRAENIAIGFQGGLVLSGVANGNFALVAFDADGNRDTRFNSDGILTTNIPGIASGLVATGNVFAPSRRLVVAGGSTVARFIDVGSIVVIGSADPDGSEAGQEPAHFFVGRTKPMPFAERVFLNVGGSARSPALIFGDYLGTNMEFVNPLSGPSFVDIPAHESVVLVTITPVDDTRIEGDETAFFTIAGNNAYDIGTTSSTTLAIRDNDVVGGPSVTSSQFLFETGPQRVQFRFNQDVATSIGANDFSVTGPSGAVPFSFGYDQLTNTATLSFGDILPDGDFVARAIATGIRNAGNQPMAADHVLDFFFLQGDASRDRKVNIVDFLRIDRGFARGRTGFSNGDFDYSGVIDGTDFFIIDQAYLKFIGAASAIATQPSPAAAAEAPAMQPTTALFSVEDVKTDAMHTDDILTAAFDVLG